MRRIAKVVSTVMIVALLLFSTALAEWDGVTPVDFEKYPEEDRIYIGISTGITGSNPLEGEAAVTACTLACEIINEVEGGVNGKYLYPVIVDDSYTTEGAYTGVSKLVADERVVALAGPSRSNCCVAVSDLVKAAEIPQVSTGTTPTFYELDNPYLFRAMASDTVCVAAVANYAVNDLQPTMLGIMYTTDDYGIQAYNVILETVDAMGMEHVDQAFNTGDKDYTGQILNIMDAGADVIIVWGHSEDMAIAIRQIKELGFEGDLISNTGVTGDTFHSLVSEEVCDGIYAQTQLLYDESNEVQMAFREAYEKRFGEPPIDHAIAQYNTILCIYEALKIAEEPTREGIWKALPQIEFMSTIGPFVCDEKQDFFSNTYIVVNEGYTPVLIDMVEG